MIKEVSLGLSGAMMLWVGSFAVWQAATEGVTVANVGVAAVCLFGAILTLSFPARY